ncbi:MAG: hypothetical protein J6Q67_01400, partial [Clostridia bacterium]|nr:hypothetical protein [Clostridia bacterium]
LFSLLLKGISIPVFFVSSNRPVVDFKTGEPSKNANGNANFKAAVECIMNGITPDVYVTYKNYEDNRMYLHYAKALLQCRNYDENFYSNGAIDINDSNEAIKSIPEKEQVTFNELPIVELKGKKLKNCVLKITPYVGLDYDSFNLSKCRAVLHGAYHSGTACTEKSAAEYEQCGIVSSSSILNFIDRCAKEKVDFYYSPSEVEGGATVYDTVPLIKNKGVNISHGMTDELMYAKLLIEYAE